MDVCAVYQVGPTTNGWDPKASMVAEFNLDRACHAMLSHLQCVHMAPNSILSADVGEEDVSSSSCDEEIAIWIRTHVRSAALTHQLKEQHNVEHEKQNTEQKQNQLWNVVSKKCNTDATSHCKCKTWRLATHVANVNTPWCTMLHTSTLSTTSETELGYVFLQI